MGTDTMIQTLSQLFLYLLPVAGVVFLVYLIKLIKEAREVIKAIQPCLEELAKLSNNCNDQLTKFDKTLTNVAEVSEKTTDLVSHDLVKGVKNVLDVIGIVKPKD